MRTGEHNLGPEHGRLLVKTSRTGLGRRAGHDLTIEVGRWQATAVIDTDDPGRSSVAATVEVDSFQVREGTGGVKPLTDGDRADIKQTVQQKILDTARHPTISFRSTQVAGPPEAFTVEGELTIREVPRPVTVRGSVIDGRVRGGATIVQPQFGIKPYTAFFGALKLADEVEITFDLML